MSLYLLDTNILSDIIRHPAGLAAQRFLRVGDGTVVTSLIVAGEIRFGASRKASPRLTAQVEAVLSAIEILSLSPPVDAVYGRIRTELERRGQMIGANDLWIAAHALSIEAVLVTDNVGEFSRVPELRYENWLRPS